MSNPGVDPVVVILTVVRLVIAVQLLLGPENKEDKRFLRDIASASVFSIPGIWSAHNETVKRRKGIVVYCGTLL